MVELRQILVSPHDSIREVMACIDRNAKGIALVVDEECRFIDTVTDGDIRRAILAGTDLSQSISVLLEYKINSPYPQPITASVDADQGELLRLMKKHSIRHIPLLDDTGKVADLVRMEDLLPNGKLPLSAVIMAGGLGTRLRPLTEETPKPMLPIGGKPLLEKTIQQMRSAGIHQVYITTHYKGDAIAQHFGDGHGFGVDIHYVSEDRLSGTAGALSLLEPPNEPLLVMNGDILTKLDFRAMLAFHQEQQADMTVGVWQYEVQVPYGVVDTQDVQVTRLKEKPTLRFLVNAGVYLISPKAYPYIPPHIPEGQYFNMTDLIETLIENKHRVISFPIHEYWLDIGQLQDYERAQIDAKNGTI